MKVLLLIIILLLLSGCALHPRLPYTPAEKILLATAIGTQAGDYISTRGALDRGCVEANPLLKNANAPEMAAVKLLISVIIYGVSNAADTRLTRKVWLGGMSVIFGAITWHNATIDCGN